MAKSKNGLKKKKLKSLKDGLGLSMNLKEIDGISSLIEKHKKLLIDIGKL